MKQLFKLMIVPFLGLFLLVPFHATAGIIDTVTLNEGYDKGDLGRFVFLLILEIGIILFMTTILRLLAAKKK